MTARSALGSSPSQRPHRAKPGRLTTYFRCRSTARVERRPSSSWRSSWLNTSPWPSPSAHRRSPSCVPSANTFRISALSVRRDLLDAGSRARYGSIFTLGFDPGSRRSGIAAPVRLNVRNLELTQRRLLAQCRPVWLGRKPAAYTAAARATASAPAGSRIGHAGSVAARHTASETSREWVTAPPAPKRANICAASAW
jgi:hypothetical protein